MKTKLFSRLFMLAAVILTVLPSFPVQAGEAEFPEIKANLNVSDNTVILTKDTPETNENWKTAGIADPKSELKSFKEMGVVALLYDPDTKSTVRLMQKYSSKTKDIFNLSLLSEEKKKEFLNSFLSDDDDTAKVTIDEYSHPEVPFYRYGIEMERDGTFYQELIYGTIVNGYALNFDIYSQNTREPIDESFVRKLVSATHFTEFLDKAEVEKQEQDAVTRIIIFFIIIVLLIAGTVYFNKNKRKKQKAAKINKTDALTKFYIEQKKKEEENIKESVLHVNHTKYTEEVIKDFHHYNEIFKRLNIWISMVVSFLIILIFLYYSSSGLIGCTIAIVLLFAFVYYQGIRIEKLIGRTVKLYDKNKSMEAIFTFYEDYFTLSGIQYISKYPYIQITEIREYKDYIYLYIGPDKAFYLKKDNFDTGTEDFMKFIKTAVKTK